MLPFATLDPHLSEPAYAAYDTACRELEAIGRPADTSADENNARRRVADALITAMRAGERDPDRLKALALDALSRGR